MLGSVLIGSTALFSAVTGIMVPPYVYGIEAFILLFYASYLAWRDEYHARLGREQTTVGVCISARYGESRLQRRRRDD